MTIRLRGSMTNKAGNVAGYAKPTKKVCHRLHGKKRSHRSKAYAALLPECQPRATRGWHSGLVRTIGLHPDPVGVEANRSVNARLPSIHEVLHTQRAYALKADRPSS